MDEIQINIGSLVVKGLALYGLGQYEEAIRYYDKVLDIDPNNVVALENKQLFRINQNESFANLQVFNNVLQEQKPGSITEMINGNRMLVFYEPVQFHSTTWAVLLLKPL